MAAKERGAAPPAKKPGRIAQVKQVFLSAKAVDPAIGWWMALAALGVLVVAAVVGIIFSALIYALIIGLPLAFLAATIVLSRRAERAAYKQIEGQPGAVGAALRSIRRGWYIEETPVAADAQRATDLQSAALVYRAVGRPGIVLIGEGPPGRAQKLLAAERRKVERVASGVPVTLLRVGDGGTEDEVTIRKLANRVQRMKPVLTKDEVSVVNKRLKSIGGVRPPLPKGVDPTKVRMDRKAMRGR
ncbi:MAG TPA: DUF4191 domain-containing protein [Lapillicoccus sp.]|jgi:hypothetical protein|uniref:DUF4191 domain-containing protein n=1 Tax=Lapillicoccus sp. TaxID=1909287 RepID=UPI002F9586A0